MLDHGRQRNGDDCVQTYQFTGRRRRRRRCKSDAAAVRRTADPPSQLLAAADRLLTPACYVFASLIYN